MDKLQILREKVERLKSQLIRGACSSQITMETNCKEEAYDEVLTILDSLQKEPVSKRFVFKAIPRLLEMIEPTNRAKAYTAKLADALEVEGYSFDAKIVREGIKVMNGEKVPVATMDDEPASDDLEEAAKQFATDTETGKVDVVKQSSFLWGAIYHKQQMMAKAVDVTIAIPCQNLDGGYTQLVDSKEVLPYGENLKVLVIKRNV